MIVPTPIEELPGFDSAENGIKGPGSNPWLKWMIYGGFFLAGVAVSAAVIHIHGQHRIKKYKEKYS